MSLELREIWLSELLANWQMNIDRLPALGTARLYPQKVPLVLIYTTGRVDHGPQRGRKD